MTGRGSRGRVPVVALTGHLGAGKTSLLNHVLRRPGARLGVVVNDFGALNVDAGLVTGHIDEAATISGGCLCCLDDAGGLDEALRQLSRPKLGLDAILVEASGLADPIALAHLIRTSGVTRVRPGGAVDVIDAVEHFRTVDIWPTPPARYAAATLVVVGKTYLLPVGERESTLSRIRERVGQTNPHAQVIEAKHGRIDPALVFDAAADDDPADELPISQLLRDDAVSHEARAHDYPHAAAAAVRLERPVDPSLLIDLLEEPPHGTYRAKGRVRVHASRGERGYLVNVVGRSIHVAALPVPPSEGELVVIGQSLDATVAQRTLDQFASAPADSVDEPGLRRLRRYVRLSA